MAERTLRRGAPRRVALVVGAALLIMSTSAAHAEAPARRPERPGAAEPNTPPNPRDRKLAVAWRAMDLSNYGRAERALESVLEDPQATRTEKAEATFAFGYYWQFRQPGHDQAAADEHYRRVLSDYGRTPIAPWAMMSLARMADTPRLEKNRDVARARELYRRIIDQYPRHVLVHEATLWLGMTYLSERDDLQAVKKGVEIYERHLAEYPDSFTTMPMHHFLGGYYGWRRNWAKAVEHYRSAERAGYASRTARGNICFKIAVIAEEELQDYELAIEYYDIVANEIARHGKNYVSQLGIERCKARLNARRVSSGPAPATQPVEEGG